MTTAVELVSRRPPVAQQVRADIDVPRILDELARLPHFEQQISLQQTAAADDPGLGWELRHPERDYVEPAFDLPYLNGLIAELAMFRTRVIRMKARRCFSWHHDETRRIHIPVTVNPGSFLVVDDRVVRLEPGRAYLIDTTRDHTAVNAALPDEQPDRIHVIGCVDRAFDVR